MFIYVARKSADRPEVQRFVDAYFSASALTREVGYVELTPQINDLAKKHFADRKVGTAFRSGRFPGWFDTRAAVDARAMILRDAQGVSDDSTPHGVALTIQIFNWFSQKRGLS